MVDWEWGGAGAMAVVREVMGVVEVEEGWVAQGDGRGWGGGGARNPENETLYTHSAGGLGAGVHVDGRNGFHRIRKK
ncbi:hypothetical protein CYMTET_20278, partial [Cymbomonas tetramitiformis]